MTCKKRLKCLFRLDRGIGPAVRQLLQKYGLSADAVKGTGRDGRLMKGDVLDHVKAKGLQPVKAAAGG